MNQNDAWLHLRALAEAAVEAAHSSTAAPVQAPMDQVRLALMREQWCELDERLNLSNFIMAILKINSEAFGSPCSL